MYRQFNNLYAPPESTGGSTTLPAPDLSVNDIVDILGEDDKVEEIPLKEDKKEPEKKETKEDEQEEQEETEDELKALEEDLKIDEEGIDEEEIVVPIARQQILKKDPEVFKKFPELERSYYRDREFSELYPTIKEAKEAKSSLETLNNLEQDLGNGDTEKLLTFVKNENPKGFTKLVDNYLDTLARVDKDAHTHIVGNVAKYIIANMLRKGKETGREPLEIAARTLNEYLFDSAEFTPPTKLSKEDVKDDRQKALDDRERQIFTRQLNDATSDLNTKVENSLKATIASNIDPKGVMSDYIKDTAAEKVFNKLSSLLDGDKRFIAIKDKLWEKAMRSGFSEEAKGEIKKLFFTRARAILPDLLKQERINALKGMGKRVKEDDPTPSKKGPLQPGRSQSHERNSDNKKQDDGPRPGESSRDYLMRD